MDKTDRDIASAMKWGKWPFSILMFIAATIVIVNSGGSGSTFVAEFFGWYFGLAFAFTLVSAGFDIFYSALILEKFSTSYPNEYPDFPWMRSPLGNWRFLKSAMSINDDALNRLCKRALFWFVCTISILITWPFGAVVFVFNETMIIKT